MWPHLREEFGRLLGRPVTEWLGHDANGVFQQTSNDDPLVWHHDTQGFAAAVYLTPDAPPEDWHKLLARPNLWLSAKAESPSRVSSTREL